LDRRLGGPRTGLDDVERRKILPPGTRTRAVHSVASRYTDCAILAVVVVVAAAAAAVAAAAVVVVVVIVVVVVVVVVMCQCASSTGKHVRAH
jgi:hypothetical protein